MAGPLPAAARRRRARAGLARWFAASPAVAVVAGLLAGCAHADAAAELTSLMQADRDFARDTQARGVEGWLAAFADDGEMLTDRGRIRGKAQIRAAMGPALDKGALVWEPAFARASEDGTLGYTYGNGTYLPKDGSERSQSKYVTCWRKVDGTWKVALDIGANNHLPDAPPIPGENVGGARGPLSEQAR